MRRITVFALAMLCVFVISGSTMADLCSIPRFSGDVYAVSLPADFGGNVVYFVFDGDMFSEYVYSPATSQTRLLVSTRVTRSTLPDGTRSYVFPTPPRESGPVAPLRVVADESDLIFPGGVRMARVFDPAVPVPTFAQNNPHIALNVRGRAVAASGTRALQPRPATDIMCCAACWGVHGGLTGGIGPFFGIDFNLSFDWLCCGGGC